MIAADRKQAMTFANALAAEHLTVDAADLPEVRHAGSVFVGDHSPQALGDYASGPNHVLPTGGVARHRGGLSVLDFLKVVSVQECTRAGLNHLAPVVTTLSEAEGLRAHTESIRIRLAPAKTSKRKRAAGGSHA